MDERRAVITVTVRFFAAARAAAGTAVAAVSIHSEGCIADALAAVGGNDPDFHAVIGRCSFLVNALATTDARTPLSTLDVVDVLPPFAGG